MYKDSDITQITNLVLLWSNKMITLLLKENDSCLKNENANNLLESQKEALSMYTTLNMT